ncbi:hypothetical protein [Parafrankia soli]|nr:hypothetical protein [Parafrankia soli]
MLSSLQPAAGGTSPGGHAAGRARRRAGTPPGGRVARRARRRRVRL